MPRFECSKDAIKFLALILAAPFGSCCIQTSEIWGNSSTIPTEVQLPIALLVASTRNQDYPSVSFCRHKYKTERSGNILSQDHPAKGLQFKEGL